MSYKTDKYINKSTTPIDRTRYSAFGGIRGNVGVNQIPGVPTATAEELGYISNDMEAQIAAFDLEAAQLAITPYKDVDLNGSFPVARFNEPFPVDNIDIPITSNGYQRLPQLQAPVTPTNYNPSLSRDNFSTPSHIPTTKGGGTVYYRDKTPGYFQKDGHKNEVANNPGNVWAAGNKLLYGATGRLVSKYNGQDEADSNLLVYPSAKAGFAAMDVQMSRPLYYGPIKTAFSKWQKTGFDHKLAGLRKVGIDTDKSYNELSDNDKKAMRKVWAKAEGWRKKEFY